MAGTVFTCKCGMLLKAYGDDQVGQGIVCPSCGSTVIVPAFGIAADASGASVSDDPASLPTTSRAGKWIGLACLGGLGVVTLGLSVFVLMPALSPRVAHPVVVAHTDSPRKNKLDDTTNDADPDEAPRRLRDGRERGTRKAVGKPQPKSAQRSRPGEPPPTSALRQRRPATNQASKRAQQLHARRAAMTSLMGPRTSGKMATSRTRMRRVTTLRTRGRSGRSNSPRTFRCRLRAGKARIEPNYCSAKEVRPARRSRSRTAWIGSCAISDPTGRGASITTNNAGHQPAGPSGRQPSQTPLPPGWRSCPCWVRDIIM